MVEAAARRAGLSPEEWLRHAVAMQAGDDRAPLHPETEADALDEDVGDIAASLARLGEQVRAMTDEMRTGQGGLAADGDPLPRARASADIDETARSSVEGLGDAGPPPPDNAALEAAINDAS